MTESCNQTLKFEEVGILVAECAGHGFAAARQDARVFTRVDRENVIVVGEQECPIAKDKLDFAGLEHGSVVIAESGDEHFSLQVLGGRIPVDIEKSCVDRGLAVFQNVEPPG